MNSTFIWQSKHLGLGVGIALSGLGFFLAVPNNMNSWIKIQKTSVVMGFELLETTYVRTNEIIPDGYQIAEAPVKGYHEIKAMGTGLMLLGSAMSLCFSSILKKEYERIEQSNYRLRQSEFELEDLHRDQTTEVARWAIELDAQSDISAMLNPPKAYLEDLDTEHSEEAQHFSETSTGFLGWLQSKGIQQAKVRDIAQKSFNNKKIPTETLRLWVDDLVNNGVAIWIDDKKSEFKLLSE